MRHRHKNRRGERYCRLLALIVVMQGLLSASASAAQSAAERGEQLFRGETSLTATLSGDRQPLPGLASRCANCHTATPAPDSRRPADRPAPALTAAWLTQANARRGGPPSRYSVESFCTVLRSGVDPAHVLLRRLMPNYFISDADCAALWAYLTDHDRR